ncbi:MAG: DNA adenine methylase [Clostridium sp.]|nr:DNA adenine methylase [Clostridium sp.]
MKPFVKWAGGKKRLLKEIERRLPEDFDEWENVTYVEPFVGGGAVLFHMIEHHKNITRIIINDINDVLIEAYRAIQKNPEPIISGLKEIETQYKALDINGRANMFYDFRKKFNEISTIDYHKLVLFLFFKSHLFQWAISRKQRRKIQCTTW